MNAIVIEHVPVAELPPAWRAKLAQAAGVTTVTVRIEEEASTEDPAFGIWRDHEEASDVEAYARRLRAARYSRDGSRNER